MNITLLSALDMFLRRCSEGLEILVVRGLPGPFLTQQALESYAATPKVVYFDALKSDETGITRAWIEWLYESCEQLEQLAVPMPKTVLRRKAVKKHPREVLVESETATQTSIPQCWATKLAWDAFT